MSFGSVSDRLYFKTVDTSETVHCGNFTLQNDMQLKYARMMIYKHGLTVSNQQFRLKVMPISGVGTAIATSDWFDLIDITTLTANWVGFFRFDFNNEFLEEGVQYYLQFETANYTRNGDTDYIGLSLDWPGPINDPEVPTQPPIGIELYGLE